MLSHLRGRYHFTDDWYVAADPGVTRDLVRRVGDWPTWWPSSESVVPVPPQVPGATEASRYTFRTRLAYRMEFQADVVRDEPLAVETVVAGRVRGAGSWRVTAAEGGSRVHFDWSVDPQVPWMRVLSPLAWPLFVWNHQALMAEGARGFADHLEVDLLRPPARTPSLTVALARLAAGMALFAGSALVARRVRRRAPAER